MHQRHWLELTNDEQSAWLESCRNNTAIQPKELKLNKEIILDGVYIDSENSFLCEFSEKALGVGGYLGSTIDEFLEYFINLNIADIKVNWSRFGATQYSFKNKKMLRQIFRVLSQHTDLKLMKCDCLVIPEIVCIPDYWGIDMQGMEKHAQYFDCPSSDMWEPELSFSEQYYQCQECGQHWYMELLPDEGFTPMFSWKCRDKEHIRTLYEIQEEKEWLTLLAHDGSVSGSICSQSGCNKEKLKGREVCEKHINIF